MYDKLIPLDHLLFEMMHEGSSKYAIFRFIKEDYFRITDFNETFEKLTGIGMTDDQTIISGRDDFLMYVPWADRRGLYDKLINLEPNECIELSLPISGKDTLYTDNLVRFCKFHTSEGSLCYYGFVSLSEARASIKKPANPSQKEVHIRTFGYFDVFLNGSAIAFGSAKAKELLALLVDRRGGFVSAEDAISYLWEDSPFDKSVQVKYRKTALKLKTILQEYGIEDILVVDKGSRRLNTMAVSCDLYDYLNGLSDDFRGSYMTNYSWAENTLGELVLTMK